MDRDDILRLAERARERHWQARGLTATPWSSIDEADRAAWVAVVELVIDACARAGQIERMTMTKEAQR